MMGRFDIHKEKNMSSHDVVAQIRKRFSIKQVGHSGTLDPNAEGVLNVYVGKATKFIDLLKSPDKVYEVEMKLGYTSDTLDQWGVVERLNDIKINERELLTTIFHFQGKILQVPPMVSAIKKNGKPLYKYAREGQEFELEPRPVEIFKIDLLEFSYPLISLKIHCSKGTYIRSLVRDIGAQLGTGAMMTSLIRLTNDYINLRNCATIDQTTLSDLKSLDEGLPHPKILIGEGELKAFSQGVKDARIQHPYVGDQVLLMDQDEFKGTATWDGQAYRRQKMVL